MAYSLQPATIGDAEDIAYILRQAFADDHIMKYWYPKTPANEVYERDVGLMRSWLTQDDVFGARITKLVENDTGKTVAFSRWLYPVKLTPEQAKQKQEIEESRPPHPEGANSALIDDFFGQMFAGRRKWEDTETMFHLHILAVLPSHHHRGLGSMLIRPGLEAADKAGAQTYIEASPKGYPLYRKFGWEDVDEIVIDLRPHGGDHIARQKLMMRQPEEVDA